MVTIIDPTDVPGTLRRIVRLQQTLADTEAAALAARRALNTCERRTRERLQAYPALLAEFDAAPAAQQARSADHHVRAAGRTRGATHTSTDWRRIEVKLQTITRTQQGQLVLLDRIGKATQAQERRSRALTDAMERNHHMLARLAEKREVLEAVRAGL